MLRIKFSAGRQFSASIAATSPSRKPLSRWERALIGNVSGASQYFLGIGGALGLGVTGSYVAILVGAEIAMRLSY